MLLQSPLWDAFRRNHRANIICDNTPYSSVYQSYPYEYVQHRCVYYVCLLDVSVINFRRKDEHVINIKLWLIYHKHNSKSCRYCRLPRRVTVFPCHLRGRLDHSCLTSSTFSNSVRPFNVCALVIGDSAGDGCHKVTRQQRDPEPAPVTAFKRNGQRNMSSSTLSPVPTVQPLSTGDERTSRCLVRWP